MNAAHLDRSPRLQRVLEFLSDMQEHTTRDIVIGAQVCAVNSCVAELRANGFRIECRQDMVEGRRYWHYRLASREPSSGVRGGEPAAGSAGYPSPARPASPPGSSLVAAGGSTGGGA